MDIEQTDGSLAVAAELPGVRKDEVKIEVSENTLTIRGERKQNHNAEHDGLVHQDGRFYREIPLPDGAKGDQAKAELKDGILKVSVPVQEAPRDFRQIRIAG